MLYGWHDCHDAYCYHDTPHWCHDLDCDPYEYAQRQIEIRRKNAEAEREYREKQALKKAARVARWYRFVDYIKMIFWIG